MTDEAFHAEIIIINHPPVMETGEKRRIDLKVKNLSSQLWQTRGSEPNWLMRGESEGGKYRVKVGDHWLDADQKILINDDGRVSLPDFIKPGESVYVSLSITAPPEPGLYTLELDLVQENVSWFALKGSQTVRCQITVE